MRKLGLGIFVLAHIIGAVTIFYFGIIPGFGMGLSWDPHGIGLIVGIVITLLLYSLGSWLKEKDKIHSLPSSPI